MNVCAHLSQSNVLFQVNHTHAVMCYPCPAGYFCERQGQSEICPMGYYCPASTGLDIRSCPRGTYSDEEGRYQEDQCKPCPAGQFCDGEHLSSPSGEASYHSGSFCELSNCLYQLACQLPKLLSFAFRCRGLCSGALVCLRH